MTAPKLTPGLANLRGQFDEAFPNRDRASDGTIGDAAHQAGTSGHNPDDSPGNAGKPSWSGDADSTPDIRAWDADDDLRSPDGVTMQHAVDHIRKLPGVAGVLRFIIYNRTMYHEREGFEGIPYDGPSPHTEHAHFEGAYTEVADRNITFDFKLGELTMNEASIADAVRVEFRNSLDNLSDSERNRLSTVIDAKIAARFSALTAVLAAQGRAIEALSAKVDKISVGGVDVPALVKAVNDDAARRAQD